MLHTGKFSVSRLCLSAAALAVCLVALGVAAAAQDDEAKPVYRDYKGVQIGTPAAEARAKLGDPTDKGDQIDYYAVSEKQTIQVYYDANKKVSAIAVTYLDAPSDAPTPKSIFGSDVQAKPDGAIYKMVRYPKAGYWLSYSRTTGDSPMIIITMMKIQ